MSGRGENNRLYWFGNDESRKWEMSVSFCMKLRKSLLTLIELLEMLFNATKEWIGGLIGRKEGGRKERGKEGEETRKRLKIYSVQTYKQQNSMLLNIHSSTRVVRKNINISDNIIAIRKKCNHNFDSWSGFAWRKHSRCNFKAPRVKCSALSLRSPRPDRSENHLRQRMSPVCSNCDLKTWPVLWTGPQQHR